ncbi:phosphatase PAP2 family protein [Marinilabiliaceae bacterium JC017]|nr:phosphatase PAP2 family protein [Marinilabiliaceae bacterium JC017]
MNMKKTIALLSLLLFAQQSFFAIDYNNEKIKAVCNLKLEKPSLINNKQPEVFNYYKSFQLIPPLSIITTEESEKKPWYNTRAARISYAPVAFFALGAYSWQYREDVRELRNRYIPDYENRLDDYIQYTPALAVYGLNLAGVQGKHSLKRATVNYALAGLMTFGVVTTMKYSIGEMRPDGSSKNSFPSGHTANAFMNATFFHKEFGQYRSPLYSFFGYSVATWTGVMRQLNNRHWMPDVLVGAGIGILMTELAYVITDSKFGNKGLNPPYSYTSKPFTERKPTFINAKLGYAWAAGDLTETTDGIYARTGFSAGLEGAYFFNKWMGLGGQLSISSFPISNKNLVIDEELKLIIDDTYTQAMGASYFLAGPYFHLDLGGEFGLMLNATAGYSRGADGQVVAVLTEEVADALDTKELPILQYRPKDAFAWSAGGQIMKRLNDRIALGIYSQFNANQPNMDIWEISDYDPNTKKAQQAFTETVDFDFSHWTIGFTINALL